MVERQKENKIARALAKNFIQDKFKIGNVAGFLERTIPNKTDKILNDEELSDISRAEAEKATQNIFAEALGEEKEKVETLF